MDKNKDAVFNAFIAKAVQRIKDKKVRKSRKLYVPSLDQEITIRNLDYPEVMECTGIEDENDQKKADKYAIYLAVTEPNLKDVAIKLKEQGEIKEYLEVTDIFDMSELSEIATEIMKLSGVVGSKKVTVVEELKNS